MSIQRWKINLHQLLDLPILGTKDLLQPQKIRQGQDVGDESANHRWNMERNSWSLMMLELLGQLIVKFVGIITIQQVEQVEQVPARLDLSLWIDPSKSTALNQLHHLTTQQLISWS